MEKRLYAVSSGNGNDGVSHMFPDYYVRTDDPFRLATLAMVSSFKPGFKQAALDAVNVDGEADYTISAVIYNPEDVDPSAASEDEDAPTYSEANGAWQIVEVFPVEDDDPRREIYDGFEGTFSADDLALVPTEE